MTETEQIARLLAMVPEGTCGVTAATRTLIASAALLRDALQNLLVSLMEAEEDRNPETGEEYYSVQTAREALEASAGLNPGALLPAIPSNFPEPSVIAAEPAGN